MQSDAELINSVLAGCKDAYELLIKRYEQSVRAVAIDILHDFHLASDASQDAFLTAYENLFYLRKPDSFGPWLLKIARRCAIDVARRKPRQTESQLDNALENPDGRLEAENRELLSAVLKLPKAENQVVMLRYFAGHSVKDVAEISGRSVGTITKQLSRAHKRLKKMLKEPQL